MTGIYMRVRREGIWQNLDIVELTQDELTAVFEPATKERVIMFLAGVTKWMRENLVEVPLSETDWDRADDGQGIFGGPSDSGDEKHD